MSVQIILPMPPSVNGLFAGKTRRYRSKSYEAWIVEAGLRLNLQRPSPCFGPVHLALEVEEQRTKRRQDLSNRIKAVEDLLVSHGIIEGDDQRFVRKITMEWSPEVSGVRITVTPSKP